MRLGAIAVERQADQRLLDRFVAGTPARMARNWAQVKSQHGADFLSPLA